MTMTFALIYLSFIHTRIQPQRTLLVSLLFYQSESLYALNTILTIHTTTPQITKQNTSLSLSTSLFVWFVSMWLPWRARTKTTTRPTRSRSLSVSCSSFKDIQTLLQSDPSPPSPKSPSLFRRLTLSSSLLRSFGSSPRAIPSAVSPPPDSDHAAVVVYYTSLRVVRRTYDDCRAVRSILRGFAVAIDERDVSVDERFREELQRILGRRNVPLPSVFVGGVYVGGADDVRKLYDSGELQELIGRLPKSQRNMCDLCGGLRFVVCDECDGSHKVFGEKSGGFRSCSSCNSNGLIRCPACFLVRQRYSK
ncbi:electron carrier [Spatholobus suberectus]|nr:electron carrier [Spatholobus suberectus]